MYNSENWDSKNIIKRIISDTAVFSGKRVFLLKPNYFCLQVLLYICGYRTL